MITTFEQGPIRPPSEAASLLLRFTRNCPWNKCTFCPIYKKQKFSKRSLQEIKQDIDTVKNILSELEALSEGFALGGAMTGQVLTEVFRNPAYSACFRHVAAWACNGRGTVFIQDANSLIMPTDKLVEALRYLKEKIPGVRRVTSYARSTTLARKEIEELKSIRQAGLDRIHIGLESGSDKVLEMVKKGGSAKEHILAGQKVIQAGITLSEYIMPGLGGRSLSTEHALETARVLNEINPHFIRLRSLRVPPTAPLHQELKQGDFQPLHDDAVAEEIKLLIESLEEIRSTLTSDHIMNLLEEVEGKFSDDKERMISVIDRYLALPEEERLLYRLGRRGGAVRTLDDLNSEALRARLERAHEDLRSQAHGDLERVIRELGDQYI